MRSVPERSPSGMPYARWRDADQRLISYGQWPYASWAGMFEAVRENKTGSCWGCQCLFTVWHKEMLAIARYLNLVSNSGFGSRATHAKGASRFSGLATGRVKFSPQRQGVVPCDPAADRYTANTLLAPPLVRRIGNVLFRCTRGG